MFEQLIIDNLLAIASAYCQGTGRTINAVSKDFYGRSDFFDKLKAREATITIDRLGQMIERFRAEWPTGKVSWPNTRPVFMTIVPSET
jgi:hypothetical protein